MFLQEVSKRPESLVEYTHSESSIDTALPIVISNGTREVIGDLPEPRLCDFSLGIV
jgi:hypothetical protein